MLAECILPKKKTTNKSREFLWPFCISWVCFYSALRQFDLRSSWKVGFLCQSVTLSVRYCSWLDQLSVYATRWLDVFNIYNSNNTIREYRQIDSTNDHSNKTRNEFTQWMSLHSCCNWLNTVYRRRIMNAALNRDKHVQVNRTWASSWHWANDYRMRSLREAYAWQHESCITSTHVHSQRHAA